MSPLSGFGLLCLGVGLLRGAEAASLVERLGFQPTEKAPIINCDDVGMCHAENMASFDALTNGVATSATVMMPCPWVPEVVEWRKQHPEADLGVHLTLTAEWGRYRWGPLLGRELCPSLVDDQGYMPRDCEPLWAKVNADEAYRESKAQVDMAIRLGLDPTHLDNHMGSLQTHPELWKVYLRLGKEYNLPLRLASKALYTLLGQPKQRDEYEAAGVLGPDVLMYGPDIPAPEPKDIAGVPAYYEKILRSLKPGMVTELYLHCALDGEELRNIAGSHARRQADHDWLVSPDTRKLINDLGIRLIGYKALKELQRKG